MCPFTYLTSRTRSRSSSPLPPRTPRTPRIPYAPLPDMSPYPYPRYPDLVPQHGHTHMQAQAQAQAQGVHQHPHHGHGHVQPPPPPPYPYSYYYPYYRRQRRQSLPGDVYMNAYARPYNAPFSTTTPAGSNPLWNTSHHQQPQFYPPRPQPAIYINPLLSSTNYEYTPSSSNNNTPPHPHLIWNMLYNSYSPQCRLSTDPPDQPWYSGRNECAIWPACRSIVLRIQPVSWGGCRCGASASAVIGRSLTIEARNGRWVTCGDVVDGISAFLQVKLSDGAYCPPLPPAPAPTPPHQSPSSTMVEGECEDHSGVGDWLAEVYRRNRTVLGGGPGEGVRRFDFLGEGCEFAGLELETGRGRTGSGGVGTASGVEGTSASPCVVVVRCRRVTL